MLPPATLPPAALPYCATVPRTTIRRAAPRRADVHRETISRADVQGDTIFRVPVQGVRQPRPGRHDAEKTSPAARQSITTLFPALKLAVTAESTISDGILGVPFLAPSGEEEEKGRHHGGRLHVLKKHRIISS